MRPPTRGPHFFVPPSDVRDGQATLGGDDAHHLVRVLRAHAGDPVSLADGHGRVWQAEVAGLGERVRLALTGEWTIEQPTPVLTVVQGLPKGRKLDEVVQRLSEIGVDRLVPAVTARSEVRLDGSRAARALRRWEAVALAAAMQARRVRPLEVSPVQRWPVAVRAPGAGAVLWEEAVSPLLEALGPAGGASGEVVLAVGPEGGLEREEVEACGLAAASLGPTVLRTETAALVAATLVLAHLGRLG